MVGQWKLVLGLALPPQQRRRPFSGVSWVEAGGELERRAAHQDGEEGQGAQLAALWEAGAHWAEAPLLKLEIWWETFLAREEE